MQPDYAPLKSTEMGSMLNVCVADQIWFGGRPSPEDLELAKRRGIASVIDLCSADPADGVRERCEELGLVYLTVPIKTASTTPPGTVDFVLSNLVKSDGTPTLMFCENGGVSATFFAIYRVVHDGVEVQEALIEARKAGMKPGAPENFVVEQVARLTGWDIIDEPVAQSDESAE